MGDCGYGCIAGIVCGVMFLGLLLVCACYALQGRGRVGRWVGGRAAGTLEIQEIVKDAKVQTPAEQGLGEGKKVRVVPEGKVTLEVGQKGDDPSALVPSNLKKAAAVTIDLHEPRVHTEAPADPAPPLPAPARAEEREAPTSRPAGGYPTANDVVRPGSPDARGPWGQSRHGHIVVQGPHAGEVRYGEIVGVRGAGAHVVFGMDRGGVQDAEVPVAQLRLLQQSARRADVKARTQDLSLEALGVDGRRGKVLDLQEGYLVVAFPDAPDPGPFRVLPTQVEWLPPPPPSPAAAGRAGGSLSPTRPLFPASPLEPTPPGTRLLGYGGAGRGKAHPSVVAARSSYLFPATPPPPPREVQERYPLVYSPTVGSAAAPAPALHATISTAALRNASPPPPPHDTAEYYNVGLRSPDTIRFPGTYGLRPQGFSSPGSPGLPEKAPERRPPMNDAIDGMRLVTRPEGPGHYSVTGAAVEPPRRPPGRDQQRLPQLQPINGLDAKAAATGVITDPQAFRRLLSQFYMMHNPAGLGVVDDVVARCFTAAHNDKAARELLARMVVRYPTQHAAGALTWLEHHAIGMLTESGGGVFPKVVYAKNVPGVSGAHALPMQNMQADGLPLWGDKAYTLLSSKGRWVLSAASGEIAAFSKHPHRGASPLLSWLWSDRTEPVPEIHISTDREVVGVVPKALAAAPAQRAAGPPPPTEVTMPPRDDGPTALTFHTPLTVPPHCHPGKKVNVGVVGEGAARQLQITIRDPARGDAAGASKYRLALAVDDIGYYVYFADGGGLGKVYLPANPAGLLGKLRHLAQAAGVVEDLENEWARATAEARVFTDARAAPRSRAASGLKALPAPDDPASPALDATSKTLGGTIGALDATSGNVASTSAGTLDAAKAGDAAPPPAAGSKAPAGRKKGKSKKGKHEAPPVEEEERPEGVGTA